MTKEEIYERYWKNLVQIRKIYTGNQPSSESMYLLFKRHAERERDNLLDRYGFNRSE